MTTYTVISSVTGEQMESGLSLLDAFNLATGWNVQSEDEALQGIEWLQCSPGARNHTIRTDEDAALYFQQLTESEGTCAPAVLL